MVKCASVSVHRPGACPAIYQSETSIWRWQGRARKRWRPSRRAQCAARAGQSLSIRWGSSFLASEYGLSASTRRLQPRRKPTTCFQVLCGAFLCFSVGYLTVGLSGQAVFFSPFRSQPCRRHSGPAAALRATGRTDPSTPSRSATLISDFTRTRLRLPSCHSQTRAANEEHPRPVVRFYSATDRCADPAAAIRALPPGQPAVS